ncbi:MAG: alpha/beta fold hydrolase [Pseudomonadota bacterium]
MSQLVVKTLGELTIHRDGEAVPLPASKRTRALLGYLLLTGRSHRRESLCELLWWKPDDPRGALRWSLSKIRPLVKAGDEDRLITDRERAGIDSTQIEIDRRKLAAEIDAEDTALARLEQISEKLSETLLDGCDLSDQPTFAHWLTAQRQEIERLRERVMARLATHPGLAPGRLLPLARAWCEAEPFSRRAASNLITRLEQFGLADEAREQSDVYAQRFSQAGVDWSAPTGVSSQSSSESAPEPSSAGPFLDRQKIQFCMAEDNVRIAYATVGQGLPLVKAANWLSHLELDWDAPIWSPLFRQLAMDYRLIRYDERGNGLSDWDVDDLTFDAFVTDLESVVDASGLERFALLGISQGAAVSIAYAVKHPHRVSKLILFGGYPAGWRIDANEETIREREAIMTLTASGWGQDNPAYRQIFSSTFMPTATPEELEWFNEFQRATASPENAVRFLSAFGDIDVRHLLSKLRVPTLVIHSLRDQRIPVQTGIDLATAIPNAEFLGLESDNHLLLGREPSSQAFVSAIRDFLGSASSTNNS